MRRHHKAMALLALPALCAALLIAPARCFADEINDTYTLSPSAINAVIESDKNEQTEHGEVVPDSVDTAEPDAVISPEVANETDGAGSGNEGAEDVAVDQMEYTSCDDDSPSPSTQDDETSAQDTPVEDCSDSPSITEDSEDSALSQSDVVICIGDSFLEGYSSEGSVDSWGFLIQSLTSASVFSYYQGGAGFSVTWSEQNFATLLQTALSDHPDATYIIVGGGVNDRYESISTVTSKAASFATIMQASAAKKFVFPCLYVSTDASEELLATQEAIKEGIKSVDATIVCVLDAWTWIYNTDEPETSYVSSDGLHPNAAGQQLIATHMMAAITSENPELYSMTVDDGAYVIESASNLSQVLDAAAGSTASGTNVQTYASNMTAAQKWDVSYDEVTGYYTVALSGTGQVLDVAGASAKDGANVQIYESNGTDAQLWKIVSNSNGTSTLVSKLNELLALALSGSSASNGANVCLRTLDPSSKAQQFRFLTTTPSVAASTAQIEEGAYLIAASGDSGYVVDVYAGSSSDGANVQIYTSNGTSAQKLYIKSDGNGYYTILVEGTGKYIEVDSGNLVPGSNVQQWKSTGGDSQKWAVYENSGDAAGTYSFVNKANGLYLDIASGKLVNGSNVQTYTGNGTEAQRFLLRWLGTKVEGEELVADGATAYLIESGTSDAQVLDVAGGSTSNGANVQTYQSNMSSAQKWVLTRDESTGCYTIGSSSKDGMVLDVTSGSAADGANVQLYQSNGTLAQQWRVYKSGDRIVIVSALRNDLVLDLAGAGASNGTNAQVYTYNGSKAQRFYLIDTDVQVAPTTEEVQEEVTGCTFVISSAASDPDGAYVLDVASGSSGDGANIQTYSANGTTAQKFCFIDAGEGFYCIVAAGSAKSLDVTEGNLVPGTNVQQWSTAVSNDNQRWAVRDNEDGTYSFINKATGLLLDVSGGVASDGANVQAYRDNGTSAQKFILTKILQ